MESLQNKESRAKAVLELLHADPTKNYIKGLAFYAALILLIALMVSLLGIFILGISRTEGVYVFCATLISFALIGNDQSVELGSISYAIRALSIAVFDSSGAVSKEQ